MGRAAQPIVVAIGLAVVAAAQIGSAASEAERTRSDPEASWSLHYRPDPDPIPLNELFAVEVWLEDLAPGSGPALTISGVDARMPDHGHGLTLEPVVETIAPGHFRVEGLLFHMPGLWELRFEVVRGDRRDPARFQIHLE